MATENLRKTAYAQGQRIRYLRDKVAKINMVTLAEKAEVNKNTLSCWENGNLTRPLLSKNIEKLIKAFSNYEIEVQERWLRAGEGEIPKYKGQPVEFNNSYLPLQMNHSFSESTNYQKSAEAASFELAKNFIEEMQSFASIKDAVVTKIEHNGFAPMLEKGDWVGGIWQDSSLLLEEKLCIVEIKPGMLHTASITPATKSGLFNLSYLKDNFKLLERIEKKNVPFDRIAPVLRLWR